MALEKKPIRTLRPAPASFRLSKEAVEQLKLLSTVLNMTQTELIEALLLSEYKKCEAKYSNEIKAARQRKVKL